MKPFFRAKAASLTEATDPTRLVAVKVPSDPVVAEYPLKLIDVEFILAVTVLVQPSPQLDASPRSLYALRASDKASMWSELDLFDRR